MIRQSETSGAVICAPVMLPTDIGKTYDGYQIHGDHAFDDHAYVKTVRFATHEGQIAFDTPIWQDSDDLLVARNAA